MGFILLGGINLKGVTCGLFNDSFMSFYFTLTIYYIAKSSPILASFFASLALSLKAGGILILPGLLACVQYGFGTIKLI